MATSTALSIYFENFALSNPVCSGYAQLRYFAGEPPPLHEDKMIRSVDETTPTRLAEMGGKVALVCSNDPVLSERLAQMINQLDFQVVVADQASSALSILEDHHCDLIMLDEKYGSGELSENPVLIHMQRLPMAVRRRSFLCMLSERTPTLDRISAFRNGADVVLNLQDVAKIPLVLDRLLKDHRVFYAVFCDELDKRGAFSS